MKYLTGLLLLLIASCTIPETTTTTNLSPKDQMIAASVQVGEYCSGTIIQSDDKDGNGIFTTKVLTAKHCFEAAGGGYLPIGSGVAVNDWVYVDNKRLTTPNRLSMTVEEYNDDDLALLTMESVRRWPSVPIATTEVKDSLQFGELVSNVSFPYGLEQFYTEGFLGHIKDSDQLAAINIAPGSSGSSFVVVRDNVPYVIGVLSAMYALETDSFGYITTWSTAQDIIKLLEG